ncbi:MAG: acylphosphatase [Calditrichaceae bacterium]|nr:acylphosphatase [Calditrichaceae bacterium]
MKIAYKIIVQGKVQGVGYRWFTLQIAQQLNIKGYVKNLDNGDVEIFAQGDEASIHEMLVQLRKGPSFSNVTNIAILDVDIDHNLNQFKVTH